MLQIVVPSIELYDEEKNEFLTTKEQVLQLEHSLVSLSKWESKWCKPFLSKEDKTNEQVRDYIRCMNMGTVQDPKVFDYLPKSILDDINEYIKAPMTATTFAKTDDLPSRQIVTAEIIYYWMITFNVPFECQKWHLNRLLTLINVCQLKNAPSKKIKGKALMSQNRALNEARKLSMNTKG